MARPMTKSWDIEKELGGDTLVIRANSMWQIRRLDGIDQPQTRKKNMGELLKQAARLRLIWTRYTGVEERAA